MTTEKFNDQKWVRRWEEEKIFEADADPKKGKVFVTFPYPYMNGPLHLGHVFSGSRIDAYARFKRMQGYNVLFPWAWHWTGQPVVSAVRRYIEGDPLQIKIFTEIDKVPEDELKHFNDPVYVADYYTRENRQTVKNLGFSVDWRREFHTTSHEPLYSRFVEWQYNTLKALGYVVQGTHPVVWCPKDQSPTQDHDRLEGEGVAPEEYTAIKFQTDQDKTFLLAGTLRPETIFGVTNVWVNPDGDYVVVAVHGERWIMSRQAGLKLKEQMDDVEIQNSFKGTELTGKECTAPLTGRRIPILPAEFVDTDSVTGVVYSVPAHAPYDWLALRDLRQSSLDQKSKNMAESIQPISIISVQGFGEFPAIELVEKMKIKDQHDQKAEEATKELYSKEFHAGRLKENCADYAGMPVAKAKQLILDDLTKRNLAMQFFDLPERVVCRCGTVCIVKMLKDQWFLKYSDQEWKARSALAVSRANVFPPEARNQFIQTIYWLKDYPCARKTGLGTPLPWDKEWLVETLSDSTIYMAFYTIIPRLREKGIRPEQLTDQLLDYVFLGKGEASKIASDTNLEEDFVQQLRSEFLYWYPVNLRNSGKDLVSNHLTFFIMHHVALFDEELWPTAIGVNGMVQLEGARMSKSHGNFIAAKDAITKYGADATRATLLSTAEGLDDPDWRSKNAQDFKQKIESLPGLVTKVTNDAEDRTEGELDRWLIAKLQERIKAVTESMETLKTRTAFFNAFFAPWNDLKWYLRRGKPNRRTVQLFFSTWTKLLSPFTPFVAEEMNHALGGKGLVSSSIWPEYDPSLIDPRAELSEDLVQEVISDIKEISSVINSKVTSAKIFVSNSQRRSTLKDVYNLLKEGRKEGEVIASFVSKSKPEEKGRVANEVQTMIKYCRELGMEKVGKLVSIQLDEYSILSSASDFICKETSLERLEVLQSDGLEAKKGRVPLPMKPVILLS
ncbi:MAG: leucine--tRNA ligase [Conexivisphaerales archaeon]